MFGPQPFRYTFFDTPWRPEWDNNTTDREWEFVDRPQIKELQAWMQSTKENPVCFVCGPMKVGKTSIFMKACTSASIRGTVYHLHYENKTERRPIRTKEEFWHCVARLCARADLEDYKSKNMTEDAFIRNVKDKIRYIKDCWWILELDYHSPNEDLWNSIHELVKTPGHKLIVELRDKVHGERLRHAPFSAQRDLGQWTTSQHRQPRRAQGQLPTLKNAAQIQIPCFSEQEFEAFIGDHTNDRQNIEAYAGRNPYSLQIVCVHLSAYQKSEVPQRSFIEKISLTADEINKFEEMVTDEFGTWTSCRENPAALALLREAGLTQKTEPTKPIRLLSNWAEADQTDFPLNTVVFTVGKNDLSAVAAGTAFLIDASRAVTCLHVILDALGHEAVRKDLDVAVTKLHVRTPGGPVGITRCYHLAAPDTPRNNLSANDDICFLELATPFKNYYRLADTEVLPDMTVHGFRSKTNIGEILKDISVVGSPDGKHVQIEFSNNSPHKIDRGMSGTPLYQPDNVQQGWIGMLQCRPVDDTTKSVGYVIPARLIKEALSVSLVRP